MPFDDYNLITEMNEENTTDTEVLTPIKSTFLKYKPKQIFLLVQIVLSIFIILSVFTLKGLNSDYFKFFQNWYNEKINDSLIAGSDIDKYKNVFKNFSQDITEKSYVPASSTASNNLNISVMLSKPTTNGTITSKFGNRIDPITHQEKIHHGLDIGTKKRENIVAVMPGTVKKVDFNKSHGNYVVIDHGNDIETLYAHCDEIIVSQDQFVARNQAVALVGESGRTTGNHLHIELLIDGKHQDPEQFLKGNYINL